MRFEKEKLDFTVHKDNPWNHIKKQYLKHLVKFIGEVYWNENVEVYGSPNYHLYEKLAGYMKLNIKIVPSMYVWIFDYIESIRNVEDFLISVGQNSREDARIFITCPHRSWTPTWSYNHWHEIDPERFMWLADYCGFKVVRHECHTIWKKWYQYIGFRPLLRLLFSRYKLHIYELRVK